MPTKRDQLGDLGERLAEDYLKRNGYQILDRHYQAKKFGEIDLVAKDKNQLVFVEVKLKTNRSFGLPEEEFTFFKKKKIRRAIQDYFWQKKINEENWRLDMVAIELENNLEPIIRHHQGVEV